MKNAGKACNNRLYRHIRTFEKIVKNYFVILYTYKTKISILESIIKQRHNKNLWDYGVYLSFESWKI